MSELPKSVVIGGRRYPTWALSVRARESLVNLNRVDQHIAQLRQRLALYSTARDECKQQLLKGLPDKPQASPAPRYYWHMASQEWAQANWPVQASTLELHGLKAASHYREGDCALVYVKGYGVVGWGDVEAGVEATPGRLTWRFKVARLEDALPANTLKNFSVRHPNRVSQRLPSSADVTRLLHALESRPPAALKAAK